MIDVPPTVTYAPAAPPAWDPPEPRRPSLWPAAVGLLITVLVVAGALVAVLTGLRTRYAEPAGSCSAVDAAPVAALVARPTPAARPSPVGGDCVARFGAAGQPAVALLTVTVEVHDSAAEAILAYRTTIDGDVPGTSVALPGGPYGRLSARDDPASQFCQYTAALQDVNATMKATLSLVPAAGVRSCDPADAGARALARTMRGSLTRLR